MCDGSYVSNNDDDSISIVIMLAVVVVTTNVGGGSGDECNISHDIKNEYKNILKIMFETQIKKLPITPNGAQMLRFYLSKVITSSLSSLPHLHR